MRRALFCWMFAWLQACCLAPFLAQMALAQDLLIRIEGRAQGGLRFLAGAKTIEVDAETAALLASVRFTLECVDDPTCADQKAEPIEGIRKVLDDDALQAVLIKAGDKILAPLAEQIRRAGRIRIQSPANLLKIAIDALQFDGQPLFVQKPVVYTIGRDVSPSPLTANPSWPGLLISDRSTDPQRAVFEVAKLFPRSDVLDVAKIDLPQLLFHVPVDFALISAHGRAGYREDDFIQLADLQVLSPGDLARLRPRLVYFDSCNLGISPRYLEALRLSGVQYALAPMLSNEAGNSSTRTIKAFFGTLAAGVDPVTALHRTRKELYAFYAGDELHTLLWRAFPLRIYALN